MTTWISDGNGNKCSVEYFGSEEAAKKALDSLERCKNCINCSRCYDCSGCSRCSDCSGCSRCYGCSGCSDCYGCSDCSGCSRCYGCSRCSDCSGNVGDKEDAIEVPVIESIHSTVFKAASQPKSLDMSDWHTCDNTHCRAGWVVTIAGEQGKLLEDKYDTCLAAMMIYDASDPSFKINPCRFFDTNDDALADMKKMADAEVSG